MAELVFQKAGWNQVADLLYFRLVLARPEAKAIIAPKEKRDEKGVVLEGGETGSNDNALKNASKIHAME